MQSYVQVFDNKGNEIESFITHYKTLKGFITYGLKNWIKNKNATSFVFSTFDCSSQLYSKNFISQKRYTI